MTDYFPYLQSAFEECLQDGISTCKFFFGMQHNFEALNDQCIDILKNQPMYIYVVLKGEDDVIHDWYDYIKYFLKNINLKIPGRNLEIQSFSNIIHWLSQNNPSASNLQEIDYSYSSLRNAIIHFLSQQDKNSDLFSLLSDYINGEYIKISSLRNYGINDVKLNLNKRSCICFLQTCIDILISLNANMILMMNMGKTSIGKTKYFIPSQIIKDLIDLTAFNQLKNTVSVFVINGYFVDFAKDNEALLSRLDNCSHDSTPHFPPVSPVIKI